MLVLSLTHHSLTGFLPARIFRALLRALDQHRCATGAALPCCANLSSQTKQALCYFGMGDREIQKVSGRFWDSLGSIASGVV